MYLRLFTTLGVAFVIGSIAYCAIGFIGLEEVLGLWWALGALFLVIFFRFTLLIALGVFYFVTDILDLHWAIGIIATIPSLIIMFLSIILGFVERHKTLDNRSK